MGQRRRRSRRQIFFYVQHRGNARLAVLLALGTFAALAFLLMDLQLRPQIREWGQARARYLATQAINQAISQELEENGEEYQDLVRFEKDQFGQILAVQTDVVKVNTMKSRMIARVSQKLNDASAATIRIPLGNATGMDLLYGRGPKIPLRMIPLGSANADFVSVFTNAGINQTRHQVVIQAEVELSVLAPGSETTLTVSSQISVAETVLIGNVPDSYTYLDTQGENLLQDYYLLKNKGDQAP